MQKITNNEDYFLGFTNGYNKGYEECLEETRERLKDKVIISEGDDICVVKCTRAEKTFGRIEAVCMLFISLVIFVGTIQRASNSGWFLFAELSAFVGMIMALYLFMKNERREEIDDDSEEKTDI